MPDHNTQSKKQHSSQWLILGIIASGLLLFLCFAFIRHVVLTLPFPYPVEYGEGVVVGWLQRLYQGKEIYPAVSAETFPWLHNPYGPLWFVLGAPLWGLGSSIFLGARFLSLAGFGLSLFVLYRLGRRDSGAGGAAAVCALFGLSPLVWRYAVMARVDMVAIAASLAALWLMEQCLRQDRHSDSPAYRQSCFWHWRWFFAGALASMAVLIKPIFVAAPLAGLLSVHRSWRTRGVPFASGLVVPVLLAGLWLLARGDTGIVDHFGWMNRIGFSISLLGNIAIEGAARHPFVMVCLLIGLCSVDRGSPRWWFALFMTGMLLFALKSGSDAHYFLPVLAAGAVMAAPVVSQIRKEGYACIVLGCLVAQLALYLPITPRPVFTATYGQEVPAAHSALTPGESDRRIGRRLVQEIAGVDSPVLADDPGYILAGGRGIIVQPFQYGHLVEAGPMEDGPLQKRIEEGDFALVILREAQTKITGGSDFPPNIVESIENNYQVHREIGPYVLYVEK